MPSKYFLNSYITVELWGGKDKIISHSVRSMQDVPEKLAEFRQIAIQKCYTTWATYLVQRVYKPGVIRNRKLTVQQQRKWKLWEKKNIINNIKINF